MNAPSAPPTTRPKAPPRGPTAAPPPTATNGAGAVIGLPQPTFQPPRIIINAVEGFGKTSAGANAPDPVILMAAGETGYLTLLGSGLVPQVPVAKIEGWAQLLATVDALAESPDTPCQTLVLDALSGFERMCHENVCKRDFKGEWGEKGFGAYQKGYDLSVTDWLELLAKLDALRERRGATILLLSHCKVKTFKNPEAADYDRWVSDIHDKTWSATAKWSDAILFGNFYVAVEGGATGERPKKGKGVGGTSRVLYCERRSAFDAKNRYGMPESIDVPADASQNWAVIWNNIRKEG